MVVAGNFYYQLSNILLTCVHFVITDFFSFDCFQLSKL